MQNFFQAASNLWEHAKETIVDTVGMATDRVLPESFIEDSQSKAILDKFDRIALQSQEILAKVHLLREKLVDLSLSYANVSSSFSIIIPNTNERDDSSSISNIDNSITDIKESIEKYKQFAEFLSNLSNNRIPNEIEKDFDSIINRIKSKTNERNDFSQNCLKAERLRKTIISSIESSPPDRLVELEHQEQDVKENLAALKQILAAESKLVEDEFTKSRENALKMILQYEQESFKQFE